MAWVRSEYAGELAVLSTWLVALLPWSFSFVNIGPEVFGKPVQVINIRWHVFQLHYVFGVSFGEQGGLGSVVWLLHEVPDKVPGDQVFASLVWIAGTAVFVVTFLLSLAYYLRETAFEEAVTEYGVHPVRVFGGLLTASGLVFWAATVLFQRQQEVTLPVGALFALVFGALLLRADVT